MTEQLVLDELAVGEETNGFPLSSHVLMLHDRHRCRTFGRAISATVKPGDTVVDVGTGTGILALLAARQGAKRVLAVDNSPSLRVAQDVVRHNGLESTIKCRDLDACEDPLPRIRADVIICELLGCFGIDEGITTVAARWCKSILKKTGVFIPNNCTLYVAPVECREVSDSLRFWSRRRYGIDFSPFLESAYNCVYHMPEVPFRFLAEPATLTHMDFHTLKSPRIRASAEQTINESGTMHGYIGWFSSDLCDGIKITNDPHEPETHWHPVFMPVKPVRVSPGASTTFDFRYAPPGTMTWKGCIESSRGRRIRDFAHSGYDI